MNHRGSRRTGRRAAALVTPVSLLLALFAALAAAPAVTGSGAMVVVASTEAAPVGKTPDALPKVVPDANRAIITLTAVTPTVVAPGDEVVIRGTLTAPASGPLTGPSLRVVLGTADLTQRAAIDAWSRGTTAAAGRELVSTPVGSVAAGQTKPFTVTLPAGKVRSTEAFAPLPISIEVDQEGATVPTGVTRTFLAWQQRKEYVPLQLAAVLPVTLDPELDLFSRNTATREAAWRRTIGPDSRIRRIVDGTKGTPVTLAVDPSVFGPDTGLPAPTKAPSATATTPTGSSTDAGTPTSPSPTQTGQADSVTALSDQLAAQLRGHSLWALPYADADLAATVTVDPTNSLMRHLVNRSSIVDATVGEKTRRDIAWPVDGLLPPGRERGLKTLFSATTVRKPAGIVVNEQAVTSSTAYTPTARRVTASGTPLLAYDERLSALLPNRSEATPVLSTQRFLAETLVLVRERPGTPRSVLLAAPRTYDPDESGLASFLATATNVPWLQPVDASSLLARGGGDKPVPAQVPARPVPSDAPPPTLTAARLRLMAAQRETLLRVATVLEDGEAFARTYGELLDELASVRWRYEPEAWTTLANSVIADTRAATSAIRVVGRTVNFLAENGTLQVTVENGLDYAVDDIRLRLEPTNPRLQVVEQPGPITIGPGSKTNVPVRIRAVAAGRADIRAYLTTSDGTPIGSPAVIPVTANPIDGTIYWVGGILVGLVLLAGVARTIWRGTSRIDEIGDIDVLEGDLEDASAAPPAGQAGDSGSEAFDEPSGASRDETTSGARPGSATHERAKRDDEA
ncbi:hypothetical protein N865_11885 [Intrasporangium oryzae NRRL B-24470]|uniref:Glycoprotein n=1 Tax=Intrasporangium oryzae NRRL B-24470 TaxID=1386089 RepID=W9G6W4_9MICO|nr:DUF6049 family protein [Intrasporangium oryzae]EWT01012.1 hypothetical protein N865_11885 [Intrasporangium oryzae NRRL B-24470]